MRLDRIWKKWNLLSKYTKYTIAIIITGTLIRFYLAYTSVALSGVETWHLNVAKYVAVIKQIPPFVPFPKETFEYTPLFHIIGAIVYSILKPLSRSVAEVGLKFITPVFSGASLVLIYLIAKKFFNEKITFFVMLFMSFLPIHLSVAAYTTIDTEVAFFIYLSIFLLLNNKLVWSAITFALSYYSKLYGLVFFPLFVYIIIKKSRLKKEAVKKILIFTAITLFLISPWFIRNEIFYGNPTFPMLNKFFKGNVETFVGKKDISPYIMNSKNHLLKWFTGIYGFPEEDKDVRLTLKGISKKSVKDMANTDSGLVFFAFNIYFIMFSIFSVPIIFGIYWLYKKRKLLDTLLIWLCCGILWQLIFIFYVINNSVTRYFVSSIPAIAMLWGYGSYNITKSKFFSKRIIRILASLFIAGMILSFVSVETLKVNYIASRFHKHDDVFKWVSLNIPEHAYFYNTTDLFIYYANGYHTKSIEKIFKEKGFFVTQEEGYVSSPLFLPEKLPAEVKDKVKLIYENKNSRVSIYSIKE
jgi:4-amino-4-deoxy-L-arabinose transferase-like glycosyltransferase